MSIDSRNSTIFKTPPFIDISVTPQAKRAEQLRRWEESATSKEGTTPKDNNRRIMFSDPCVFLAACTAGDKEEARRLLYKGVDINTANTDGITALHQACIDDDLDMVEFLVQNGADLNRGDNEGWTPLHATSSCGVLSIAKYLIDQGADVAAVNNDGELAMDLCKSPETYDVADMLQHEINIRGIDCHAARKEEENRLISDARQWINSGQIMEQPHPKTGATGLHVAAAKGYIPAMQLLIRCGADINAQDYDGWTPLHAAGYWAQRGACELLAENLCNMDIKNYQGQTAFDVADDEVLTLLEQLKDRQAMLARERPEVAEIISRRPQPPYRRRSSVSRMSASDRASQVSRDASSEMERMRDLRIEDEHADQPTRPTNAEQVELRKKANQQQQRTQRPASQPAPPAPPAFSPRPPDPAETDTQSWRRPAASQRLSAPDDTRSNKQRDESSRAAEPADTRRVQSAPPPAALSPTSGTPSEQTVSATIIQSPPASPVAPGAPPSRSVPSGGDVVDGPQREPPVPPARASAQTPAQTPAPAAAQGKVQVDQQPATPAAPAATTASKLSPATIFKNIFKSFVPPVREEESETQRKAHAKRVRETRRSTQGVTLEELKSAEQYVKNQQQQQKEQQQQQQQKAAAPAAPAAAPLAREEPSPRDEQNMERRPSWRLRLDEGDKNKEVRGGGDATRGNSRTAAGTPTSPEVDTTVTLPLRRKTNSADTPAGGGGATLPATAQPPADDKGDDKENDSRTAVATQAAIQRRRKPKRRSTGVVQFDVEENEKKAGRDGDSSDPSATLSNQSNANASSECSSRTASRANSVENGEVDYKKLYEAAMVENDKLQQRLAEAHADCRDTKLNLDKTLQMNSSRAAAAESDKREKRAIERKLSEMEEELKAMEELKADNRRLRDENGALIRVISKLSK